MEIVRNSFEIYSELERLDGKENTSFYIIDENANIFRITKLIDTDGPADPRFNQTNIGTFVCFNNAHPIGHINPSSYSTTPKQWFGDALLAYMDQIKVNGWPVYRYMLNQSSPKARIILTDDYIQLQENTSIGTTKEPVWKNDMALTRSKYPTMESLRTNANAGTRTFLKRCINALLHKDIYNILYDLGWTFKPVYLQSGAITSVSVHPYEDPWDSGLVGWIYTTKEKLAELKGFIPSDEDVLAALTEEIEAINFWLNGTAYIIHIDKWHPCNDQPLSADGNDIEFDPIAVKSGLCNEYEMEDFISATVGPKYQYFNRLHFEVISTKKRLDCPFCEGKKTVTGKLLGPKKIFFGHCSQCNATLIQ